MYNESTRERALALVATGISLNQASKQLGISRAAMRSWRDGRSLGFTVRATSCPRCSTAALDRSAYALLLGYYLGDGCLSSMPKGVYMLRVSSDAKYLRVVTDVERAMIGVHLCRRTYRVRAPGATVVQSMWKHWICLFPQHGSGRKHQRAIVLADWQRAIVDEYPKPLLRGLFMSDGCRVANWTVRHLTSGPRRYGYTRYMFSNKSEDILGICIDALDRIGVHWTRPRRNVLSVARRVDVARLDEFIGPKS
jgi:hypothetical protein